MAIGVLVILIIGALVVGGFVVFLVYLFRKTRKSKSNYQEQSFVDLGFKESDGSANVTVNNYYIVNNNGKRSKKKSERSDMEKILIKNAKIDALASIDPKDTEKTKEQIDVVKKLDDLD